MFVPSGAVSLQSLCGEDIGHWALGIGHWTLGKTFTRIDHSSTLGQL